MNLFRFTVMISLLCVGSRSAEPHVRRDIGAGQVLTVAVTQQAARALQADEVIQCEIKGRERQLFTFYLAANQRGRVVVRRQGVDLLISVIGPDGAISKYENPAGPYSPLYAFIKSGIAGNFSVEVSPVQKWISAARFTISLEETRDDFGDRTFDQQLAAQQKVAAARQLRVQLTPESARAVFVSYAEALSLAQTAGDTFQEANVLHYVAKAYESLLDIDNAEQFYMRALEKRSDDHSARAYTLLDLAGAIYAIKGPVASTVRYQEAAAAFREIQDNRGRASALTQLALIHMREYEWDAARVILQEALELDRREGDRHEEARVLNALGGVSDNQSQPNEALRYYETARSTFEELGDYARLGNMYINIGQIHDTSGEWREALVNYNRALEFLALAQQIGDTELPYITAKTAAAFYNIGSLYASLGDYQLALECLEKSLLRRPEEQRGPTLMWMAYTYVLSGNPAKAAEFSERALKIQNRTPDPRLGQTYTVMGMAQAAQGKHYEALEYFNKALKIQQNVLTLDAKGEAISLEKRGEVYGALGQITKAREDLHAALAIFTRYDDRNGQALSHFYLAKIGAASGDLNAACSDAEAASKLIETLRGHVLDQELRSKYFASRVPYYELYIGLLMESRTPQDSISKVTTAFETSERERARGLLDLLSNTLVNSASVETGDPGLSSLIEQRRTLQRSIVAKSDQLYQPTKNHGASESLVATRSEIASLSIEKDRINAEIALRYPRYAPFFSSAPQNAVQVQQQLDEDTVLLEYLLGDSRSYVWVVSRDSIVGLELPPQGQIETAANRLIEGLTARNRVGNKINPEQTRSMLVKAELDYTQASTELGQMIIGPISKLIGRKRLVVVADGLLQMVPFGALLVPDIAEPSAENKSAMTSVNSANPTLASLISTREILMLPSASSLVLQRRALANNERPLHTAAVIANPVFSRDDPRVKAGLQGRALPATISKSEGDSERQGELGGRSMVSPGTLPADSMGADSLTQALRDVGLGEIPPPLFHSQDEAEAIMKLVPKDERMLALGFKASRATAMSPELSKYRIIHFATHGMVDMEHPERSGLVLSMVDEKGRSQDGYLRLHDIYNLNLPADLVVLSACETGIGKQIKGEGLIALTRGFMYAGAKSVVASLWKVNDAATADLMSEFYRQIFVNKRKPAAALQQAQITLSQSKRWHQPYYWAGFVIQGDWK